MPDYELICWDTSRFDIRSNQFVSEAFDAKKWAFAADYIRLYALYNYGGIYLDSDVIIRKTFDDFLQYDLFSAMEYHRPYAATDLINEDGTPKTPGTHIAGIGIQAAILGSVKGHPFLKDCLTWYQDKHFILENGCYFDKLILPGILAMIAEGYGFRYLDRLQNLKDGIVILPSEILAGSRGEATSNSYAIHCAFGSWKDRPKENGAKAFLRQIRRYIFRELRDY